MDTTKLFGATYKTHVRHVKCHITFLHSNLDNHAIDNQKNLLFISMEDAENLLRDSKLFSPSSSVGSYGIREEDLDDDWCSNNRSFNFNELIGK